MNAQHDNLIAGEWTKGKATAPTSIPPTWPTSSPSTPRAMRAMSTPPSRPPRPRFPPGPPAASRRAATRWTRSAPRSSRARKSSARCWRAKKARPSPKASAKPRAPARSSSSSPANACACRARLLPSVRPGIGVEITREPVGVVGLITPWNFPIAIPAWKIAPALAFGNCVVLKPADLVPGCAWALAEIISRSGIPPGVFNLVMGRGSVIGDALVNHPGIHAISFTGSVGVGRASPMPCVHEPQEGAARDGRQEPAGRAGRRRPGTGRRAQRAERLLFDRPALHRVQPPDRHRRHLSEVHRGDEGAHGEDQGRRRAGGGHRHRPGLEPEPARAGPELHRDRPGAKAPRWPPAASA